MTARARCIFSALVMCFMLGLGACSDGGQSSGGGGVLTRAAVLLRRFIQDMDHHGHTRVFNYTISAPSARVVHIQEGLRWWALVGWVVLLLLIVRICVGMSQDLQGGLSDRQRVACGLGVAALFAIPIVDVAFKRGLWVIDAEQRTMTCNRTGPIGLFDSRDTHTLPEAPVMLASFSEHRSESVDEDGNATVSTTTSSMLYM